MTQPPYGQDPQNPYGQPGPYSPPPKKSRTVQIVAAVLVILLIAGGGLATLLLLSDSDNDKDSDQAEDRTSEPTSAPAGDLLQGNGYSYTLPDGWQDASDEAAGAPGAIDTIAVWGEKLEGGRANVIVESGPSGGESDPEALREQWQSNMTGSTGATPEKIDGTTIAGQEAIGVRIERTNDKGVAIVQTAYLVVRDGNVYSIALSGKSGDDDAEAAFADIRDSWTWE